MLVMEFLLLVLAMGTVLALLLLVIAYRATK